MGTFGDGPWKEGRAGAASLCYVDLDAAQLMRVAEHHAAVGIRATVACRSTAPILTELVARNWDLATLGPAPDVQLAGALRELDQRAQRGQVQLGTAASTAPGSSAYRVVERPGSIVSRPPLPDELPSAAAPADVPAFMKAIDEVIGRAEWGIWRMDAAFLTQVPWDEHQRLMRWLGDHHGRIWCAPVRDIAGWISAS